MGWYVNDTLLTEQQSFNYLVEYNDVTLTAKFRELPFEPSNPGEPSTASGQNDIQTNPTGDANEDGVVNISDVVAVLNAYINADTSHINVNLADVSGDDIINITDAVGIINIYLNAE